MSSNRDLRRRITLGDHAHKRKPTIRDTQVMVETVVDHLMTDSSDRDVLEQYPMLEPEDLEACRHFAISILANPLAYTDWTSAGNLDAKRERISELEELAKSVLKLKQEHVQRRPLLIEFCGSPKSGKSTTINSLNLFLRRNQFKTVVLTERASVCPIQSKTHPYFNLWTMSAAITEILFQMDQEKGKIDIVIADRGVFDALCWFKWLNNTSSTNAPNLDSKSFDILESFITMDTWTSFIDLIYVFRVEPHVSIDREYATLLTERRGSIMKEGILQGVNEATDTVIDEFGKKFREVVMIRTDTDETNRNPDQVAYDVTKDVLEKLHDLLIERIGYFELTSDQVNDSLLQPDSIANWEIKYDRRDEVEQSAKIQPIPLVVMTNKARTHVLVVKKTPRGMSKNSPEKNKLLLYLGGHVREEDRASGTLMTLAKALHREVNEEIGESIYFQDVKPFPIYSRSTDKSEQHMGICYVMEREDLEEDKFKLISEEFVMKTGSSKSGHVLSIAEITSGRYKLEAWSETILERVFNIPRNRQDSTLFPE